MKNFLILLGIGGVTAMTVFMLNQQKKIAALQAFNSIDAYDDDIEEIEVEVVTPIKPNKKIRVVQVEQPSNNMVELVPQGMFLNYNVGPCYTNQPREVAPASQEFSTNNTYMPQL